MGEITAPAPLTADHNVEDFTSGNDTLDERLKRRALKNEDIGVSRTFVVCEKKRVVGYYSLATGVITQIDVPGKIRRNMPDPIPVIILGRLAVDLQRQSQKIGEDLLQDAIKRIINVSIDIGIKAILVHAISEKARSFYLKRGFIESSTNETTLLLPLSSAIFHLD